MTVVVYMLFFLSFFLTEGFEKQKEEYENIESQLDNLRKDFYNSFRPEIMVCYSLYSYCYICVYKVLIKYYCVDIKYLMFRK